MQSHRILLYAVIVAVIGGALAGCSRGPSEEEVKQAEFQAQSAELEETYQRLRQIRDDLAAAQASLEEIEAVPERRHTDEQKALAEELPARIQELSTAQDETFDQFQSKLAAFLNVGLNDFPASPETLQGLEIYSREAILYADDAVRKAGDYKKAIEHVRGAAGYYDAIGAEPYQPLAEHLEYLESWRFITKDRFDAVRNGMTKEQVKELAGVPYYQNIKIDERKGVETWLYRRPDEGVAAFYFRIKTGKVYGKKYDAVKPKVVS